MLAPLPPIQKNVPCPQHRLVVLVTLLLIAAGIASALAPTAVAHARLASSDPPAGSALATMPSVFHITFNEQFDPGLSDFDLVDAGGVQLPLGEPEIDPDQPESVQIPFAGTDPAPGVYTLVWRVLSAVDGHVTSGSVPFSVGTGEAPAGASATSEETRPPWWQIGPRWLELSGWVLLIGVAGFGLINFSIIGSPGLAALRTSIVDRWRSVWFFGFTLALVGMILGIWAQALRVTGNTSLATPDSAALGDVLADTNYGRGWLVRLILAIVLLLTIGLAPRLNRRWHWLVLLALAIAAAGSISATGHAAGESQQWLATVVDLVHMACAGVWLGGLVALIMAIRAIAAGHADAEVDSASMLVRNQSRTSLVAMAAIVGTGTISASFHIGGNRSLRTEDYGITLLVKIALLIVVLVAAAVNLLVLRPRARAFLAAGQPSLAWKELRATGLVSTFEVAAASMIMLAAAILTVLAPADYPLSVNVAGKALQIDEISAAEELEIGLTANLRGSPGDRYTISVRDMAGGVPSDIQRVIIETELMSGAQAGLGDRFDAEAVEGAPGNFDFAASRLGLEGNWTINVIVRRAGVEDVETQFMFDTSGTSPGPQRLVDDSWRLPAMTPLAWGFAALAVTMLIVGLAGMRRLTGMEPVASGVLLATCVLIAAGFAISATQNTTPVTAGQDLENPVEFGDISLATGESLFNANCLACHGADGRGVSEPGMHSADSADLTDRAARDQTDGDLFTWISEGVPSTDMPAFDEALTEEERWHLVNYIRLLQEKDD